MGATVKMKKKVHTSVKIHGSERSNSAIDENLKGVEGEIEKRASVKEG